MSVIFFKKIVKKFDVDFRNVEEISEKIFSFLDNYIRVGYCKFFWLWREFLSSNVNVLTNSPKIKGIIKGDYSQLGFSRSYERIW